MEITDLLPARSIEDILAERVRLTIGGEAYNLPALNVEDTEAWLGELEGDLRGLLSLVEDAGDDAGKVFAELSAKPARLIDFLIAYDKMGALPDRDGLRRGLTPIGLVKAVLEVWRAANPLVDIALAGLTMSDPISASRPRTSSPRRNGAGRRAASAAS